jgi:glycosyltransferase involved in cell wall biosynthesis
VSPDAPARHEVAVVVPAFNAAATIDAALASVVAQRVQPTEIVVVDDGSRDDTVRVAQRWDALLPLRVVSKAGNSGAARTRNEGVRHTTAPMIAFLDADDVWFPNHLTACLELHDRLGGVVTGRALRWSEERGIFPGQGEDGEAGPPPGHELEWIVRNHKFGMHALIPRDVFEAVGGFDPSTGAVEDWDLWIRIAASGVPMSRTTTRTFLYRQHEANLSRRVDEVSEAALRLLDRLELEQRPLSKELRAAIRDSRALIAFNRASAHLDADDLGGARRQAAHALTGPPALVARAAVIVASPALYRSLRDRRRDPGS